MSEQDKDTKPQRPKGWVARLQKQLDDARTTDARATEEEQRQNKAREKEKKRQAQAQAQKEREKEEQRKKQQYLKKIRAEKRKQEEQLQLEQVNKKQAALAQLEQDRKKIINDHYLKKQEQLPIQEPPQQTDKRQEALKKLDNERRAIIQNNDKKQEVNRQGNKRIPLGILAPAPFEQLTAATHKRNIYNNQTAWLSGKEIAAVKHYFSQNPNSKKISRKQPIHFNNEKIFLQHSVISSDEGSLYALSRPENIYTNGIKGYLGKGSFGQVKLAQSLEDNTIVVAKIQEHTRIVAQLQPYPQAKMIELEEETQKAVGQYLGKAERTTSKSGTIRTKHYTFSDFIKGQSLSTYLNKNPNISPLTKLTIILKVLQATQNLHEKGIIHGDLSFNNILYNDKTNEINIIDFGLAVRSDHPNNVVKLPDRALKLKMLNKYFAPEGKFGFFSAKTDVHSLGYWIQQYAYDNRNLMQLAQSMSNKELQNRPDITTCINQIENCIKQQQTIHTSTRKPK